MTMWLLCMLLLVTPGFVLLRQLISTVLEPVTTRLFLADLSEGDRPRDIAYIIMATHAGRTGLQDLPAPAWAI